MIVSTPGESSRAERSIKPVSGSNRVVDLVEWAVQQLGPSGGSVSSPFCFCAEVRDNAHVGALWLTGQVE